MNERILIMGCTHIPYEHPDMLRFLRAVKNKYNPNRVIHLGDECDKQALNYHEHNPDLPSAGDELEIAKKKLKPLFSLFPTMDLMESNHGSLVFRKALSAGIPKEYMRSLQEVYGAPKGWKWHQDLTITLPNGNKLYLCHQMSSNVLTAVTLRGMCVAQAHFHSVADIRYVSNPNNLLWGMTVGCLISRKSVAFAYNKIQLKRPIISVGVVTDSVPIVIYMKQDSHGRWTGKL